MNRVVITGMGVVSALGNDIETFWNNIVNGKNGIDLITSFDTEQFNSKYADFFESKKKYKNRLSEGSARTNSNLLTELKKEKEPKTNDLIKSQPEIKISETEKDINAEEEEKIIAKRERKLTMDNLKSLSSQNLIKIDVKQEGLKVPKIEYDAFCKLNGTNLVKLDLSYCSNVKIG